MEGQLAKFIAVAIFIIVYFFIVTEKVPRATAALSGAMLVIMFGVISEKEALESINFETLGLLFGMMLVVAILRMNNFFQYVALKTYALSPHTPRKALVIFTLITALLSAFLDNVTTVLLMVPVIIEITRAWGVKATPFLIAVTIASTIGGTATMIGDPPNTIIGTTTDLAFIDFIIYLAPVVIILVILLAVIFPRYYRDDVPRFSASRYSISHMFEVSDPKTIRICLAVLGLAISLFFVHDRIGVSPALIAIGCATLLLVLTRSRPSKAFAHVEWNTLIFFGGLFVLVGALVHSGVTDQLANYLSSASNDNVVLAIIIILWMTAFLTMILSAVPLTLLMIPVVIELSAISGIALEPLLWALALGACLGGAGTLIASSANVVMSDISEHFGEKISFMQFFKIGFPITIMNLGICTLYLSLIYGL